MAPATNLVIANPEEASRHQKDISKRLSKSAQRKRVADMAEFMGNVVSKLREEFSALSRLTPEQVRAASMVVRAQAEAETQVRLARGEPLPGVRRYAEEQAKGSRKIDRPPKPEPPALIVPDPAPPLRPGPRPSSIPHHKATPAEPPACGVS